MINTEQQNKVDLFTQAIGASWDDYYNTLNELPPEFELPSCLKLLNIADGLLNQEMDFSNAELFERNLVGGVKDAQTLKKYPFATQLMGDMNSFASFKKLLRTDPSGLAKLIRIIPTTGPIDGWHYMQFIDSYRQLFSSNGFKQAQLFPATRLLTMKRPDQFVAISPETAPLFCQAFSIKALKNQDFQRYWDEIVLSLQKTAWYKVDQPMDVSQLALYRSRVALIERFICTPQTGSASNVVSPTHSETLAETDTNSANETVTTATSEIGGSQNSFVEEVRQPTVKKVVSQPKKLTIAKLKTAKGNKAAATKLMSQYYFANKDKFGKADMGASRDKIIEQLIEGKSVEDAFNEVLSGQIAKV